MWIELHDSIYDHPKVLKLSRDCHVTRAHAIGLLCSLWVWVLRMAPDGDLSSFDDDDIALGCGWDGDAKTLVDSLVSRRLLDRDKNGLSVHDWDEYHGSLKSAERAKRYRDRKRASRDGHVTVTLQSDKTSRRHADQTDQTHQTDTSEKDLLRRSLSSSETELDSSTRGDISAVYAHHRKHHPRCTDTLKSTTKEYRNIKARLSEGFTVEDLCTAIDGFNADSWVIGTGQTAKLEYLMRTKSLVDQYRERAEHGPPVVTRSKTKIELSAEEDRAITEAYNARCRAERERSAPMVHDAGERLVSSLPRSTTTTRDNALVVATPARLTAGETHGGV